jgi:hypothetical protein
MLGVVFPLAARKIASSIRGKRLHRVLYKGYPRLTHRAHCGPWDLKTVQQILN